MGAFFQNLTNDFQTKANLLDDLEEEVEDVLHSENVVLKKEICKLEEKNVHWIREFAYLKAFMEMFHEEVVPIQQQIF